MPRVQVLSARTPCCGRVVRLRRSSEGKSYKIVCPHFPDGRGMTVQRVDDVLKCIWDDAPKWIVQVVLPGDYGDVEKRFDTLAEAEGYASDVRKQFPNCFPVLLDTSP